MLSRGDNLGVGGEQDVEAKALRSVRWYARRWREKLSQKWLQSCRKMPSPAASCWASDPQRWIDIKRNQCPSARPRQKRTREPTPFAGLTHKPLCVACEHAQAHPPQGPGCPPPRKVSTRGRRRQVDT